MPRSNDLPAEMPPAYEPREVETKWYQFWLDRGFFAPAVDSAKRPFVIIMPPPNVTGELHLGHALTATIEDTLTRWHRMLGDSTLWLPGIDHAGIAGQNVVEQLLAREGKTRHDLGRDRFLERVWEWMNRYGRIISDQHRRLGVSADWSRERFTMDPGPSRAVRATFVRLFKKGLIYRGERIINWCPRCATALSDLEVDHRDTLGQLYHIRYRLVGDAQEYITVATTRPETMLGDTAVAVHPDDARYRDLIGREAILPILERRLPIIADDAVDPTFGTGAVKVTPAHDPTDYEIAQRHDLPAVTVMNLDGTMNGEAGPYAGMGRNECRESLVNDLDTAGNLVEVDAYVVPMGYCDRCGTVVEPIISKQWFVDIKPLAEPAIRAVTDGQIRIIPERFTKAYLNWMENIRDWCISRQLWWGHRIPVWYCEQCGGLTVEMEDPTACGQCGSKQIYQDPDVLDTWFSSGLWPHSTLGWPEDTEDFRYFYPTTVMETAYDILFFWVARMIMMGLENTGQAPFHTVYLHGLIRDEKGEKMSKSKGNVIDPVEFMDSYGTDAVRFALSTGNTPGNDMKMSVQRIEGGRNFANKLWNASRFVLRSLEQHRTEPVPPLGAPEDLPLEDRWILSRVNRLCQSVSQMLENFQLGEALREIYEFLWGEYCDWYLEMVKIRLRDRRREPSPLPVMVHVLEMSLRLLHPYLPFITEEIWQRLPADRRFPADSIMVSAYPAADPDALDIKAEWQVDLLINLIRGIRNARAEHHIEPARWLEATVTAGDAQPLIEEHVDILGALARVRPIHFMSRTESSRNDTAVVLVEDVEVRLNFEAAVDVATEIRRLEKDLAQVQGEISRLQSKLAGDFSSKAPAPLVEKERTRLREAETRVQPLESQLEKLRQRERES